MRYKGGTESVLPSGTTYEPLLKGFCCCARLGDDEGIERVPLDQRAKSQGILTISVQAKSYLLSHSKDVKIQSFKTFWRSSKSRLGECSEYNRTRRSIWMQTCYVQAHGWHSLIPSACFITRRREGRRNAPNATLILSVMFFNLISQFAFIKPLSQVFTFS